MNFGPSEKMGTGNQEDELVHLENLSLVWFHLYLISIEDVLQISVNCTILFLIELIFK